MGTDDGTAGDAPASRAVPAMPRDDEQDPGHESVLAAPPVTDALPPDHRDHRPRDLVGSLGRVKFALATLLVLVVAPAVLGLPGLLAALAMVVVCRFWDSRAKLVATLGLTFLSVFLAVVFAWLRATQVSEAESSGTRLSTAGRALADSFAAVPAGAGWLAAIYLGYVLVRELTDAG